MWPAPADYFADVDVIVNCTSIGFETLKRFEHGVFSLRYYTPFGPVDDTVTVSEGADFEKRYLETASAAIAKNFKQSLRVLASMNNPIVMDIIYQPRQTMLLFIANLMGYRTINGIPMNLEQAVIAFDKATMAAEMRDGGQDEVRPTRGSGAGNGHDGRFERQLGARPGLRPAGHRGGHHQGPGAGARSRGLAAKQPCRPVGGICLDDRAGRDARSGHGE